MIVIIMLIAPLRYKILCAFHTLLSFLIIQIKQDETVTNLSKLVNHNGAIRVPIEMF